MGCCWLRRVVSPVHDSALDDLAVVLALAVPAPPGVHPVLVVLHAAHVEERGSDGRDWPEERDEQLDKQPPETQEVPEAEHTPERPVLAEGGVSPVEEPVEPARVLERRLDVPLLIGRPRDSREEVVVDVLEQAGFQPVVRVVCPVRLAGDGDEHRTTHRREDEPQHGHQETTRVPRPHQVPQVHAHSHQVQRQPEHRPGESPCPCTHEVDRLRLALTGARAGGPVLSPTAVVPDLSTAHPAPQPPHQFERHPGQDDDRDDEPPQPVATPLQQVLREDGSQEVAHPGERGVVPHTEVREPVHRGQIAHLIHNVGQRPHPFRIRNDGGRRHDCIL